MPTILCFCNFLLLLMVLSNVTESLANYQNKINVSETDLGQWLFTGYSKHRRPRQNAGSNVVVSLGISVYTINNIIEKSHELRITCALRVKWLDEFLVWNETDHFRTIKSIAVDRSEIWIPDVALVNSGDMYALMMTDGILANVNNDGSVEFSPMSTISSFCQLDLTYFPFDYQSCFLRFESWTYEPNQETFALSKKPLNLENLNMNEQWQLLNASSQLESRCYFQASCYPGVTFHFIFKRKSAYYKVNIIIPSLIIAVVEIVTFSLPTAEVLKIHISITCLLAYAVFQTTINNDMPRTSEHTPLMSIYIDLQMAFIGIALLGEGVVFICLDQAEHFQQIPVGLRKLSTIVARVIFVDSSNADMEEMQLENEEAVLQKALGKEDTNAASMADGKTSKDLSASLSNEYYDDVIDAIGHRAKSNTEADRAVRQYFDRRNELMELSKKKKKQQNRHDWIFIADIADRLTLIIYIFCISITPLVVFFILPELYSSY